VGRYLYSNSASEGNILLKESKNVHSLQNKVRMASKHSSLCKGDSGSTVYNANGEQIGIASRSDCNKGNIVYFEPISKHISWMKSITG